MTSRSQGGCCAWPRPRRCSGSAAARAPPARSRGGGAAPGSIRPWSMRSSGSNTMRASGSPSNPRRGAARAARPRPCRRRRAAGSGCPRVRVDRRRQVALHRDPLRRGGRDRARSPRSWISTRTRATLRRGALLHDIGKLGVSNRILDKPGPLGPRSGTRFAAIPTGRWRYSRGSARSTTSLGSPAPTTSGSTGAGTTAADGRGARSAVADPRGRGRGRGAKRRPALPAGARARRGAGDHASGRRSRARRRAFRARTGTPGLVIEAHGRGMRYSAPGIAEHGGGVGEPLLTSIRR